MTAINFYILPITRPLKTFVCQLTRSVRQKIPDTILIFAPEPLLTSIDDWLWSFQDTAFIPHRLLDNDMTVSDVIAVNPREVLLTAHLQHLTDFKGVVINLTHDALLDAVGNASISKLLEIIVNDDINVVYGRQKYRQYRDTFSTIAIETIHIT